MQGQRNIAENSCLFETQKGFFHNLFLVKFLR